MGTWGDGNGVGEPVTTIEIGDTVIHRNDPLERRLRVIGAFWWLGQRKIQAQSYPHGEYFTDNESFFKLCTKVTVNE